MKEKSAVRTSPSPWKNLRAKDTAKAAQWRGFIRKNRLKNVPQYFVEVITTIAVFLTPIAEELAAGRVFRTTWKAPGPWRA